MSKNTIPEWMRSTKPTEAERKEVREAITRYINRRKEQEAAQ
ncbi:hypothetical protein OGY83_06510 [Citrobacter sp. Cpo090]|nr:hypothetical protein [Citrobacter sp. Cpo090]MDM2843282.1 hypothetical protein [Citrobacter sp. Cpo090]